MNIKTAAISATLSALLLPLPAQAGVGHISVAFDGSPAEIVVYNDGSRFTHITQSKLDYLVSQDIDCGRGERVHRAVLAAGLHEISTRGGALGPRPEAWDETYPGARRAVLFEVDLAAYFAPSSGRINPVEACNRKLDRLVSQGQPRWRLIERGFTLPAGHAVGLAANCIDKDAIVEAVSFPVWREGGSGWKQASDQAIGVIRCKGTGVTLATPTVPPPTGPNHLAVPFQVQGVRIKAQPKSQHVVCPATVRFDVEFEAVGKGTVRYRGNINGGLGPVKTLRFARSGRKSLSFEIQAGQSGNPPPSSSGGNGITHGGGFAPQAPPPETVSGWARVEIVAPEAGVDTSKKARYMVNCRDNPTFLNPTQPTKPDDSADDTKPCDKKPCGAKPDGGRGRSRR